MGVNLIFEDDEIKLSNAPLSLSASRSNYVCIYIYTHTHIYIYIHITHSCNYC